MSSNRIAVIGASVIGALAVGWFALSHFVMGTAAFEAVGEALGVAFALLIVASFLGAVLSGRGKHL